MSVTFPSFLLIVLVTVSLGVCNELSDDSVTNSASEVELVVPFYYQNKTYYCGPAALEMVFDYYGDDISQTEIAEVTRAHPNVTYLEDLERAARFSNLSTSLGDEMPNNITGYSLRKSGYASFLNYNLSLENLRTLISIGEPVIVLTWYAQNHEQGHFRVVVGFNETHLFMHDPWNKYLWGGVYGGPEVAMTYSAFLDLWNISDYYQALWVHPWNISIETPEAVNKGENFTVTANSFYPYPTQFGAIHKTASNCNLTIVLQTGLVLAAGEATHSMGTITVDTPVQTSWSVYALVTGPVDISVYASGYVQDYVIGHENLSQYSYEDIIGGIYKHSFSIVPEFPSTVFLLSFLAAILLAVIVLKKKKR